MTLTAWIAIAVILVTVYCLIKRYETRLVLFTAGLFLCCIAMKPMAALDRSTRQCRGHSGRIGSNLMRIRGPRGPIFLVCAFIRDFSENKS